jgi:SAM-dependent methyltransferase
LACAARLAKELVMGAAPVSDTWERGNPYEQYVGRWSRQVAPRFLAWLDLPPARHWLDVGCGTGAVSAAILDRCAPASVIAVEPSDGFRSEAQALLSTRAAVLAGRADNLPLDDAAVDATVSGLVLNFVPEPRSALAEMKRVTRPGGTIAAYVWDYAGEMELMRHFWDAAVELDPGAALLDEGVRFPICRPDALRALFADVGLRQGEVEGIDIPTSFDSFDDYWHPFLGGQGPAPAYAMTLSDAARTRLRDRIRARLPVRPDGAIALKARAWAVRGTVAG